MLAITGLRAWKAHRDFTQQPRVNQILRGPRGEAPYIVTPDHSLPLADIILDEHAAEVVRALGPGLYVSLNQEPSEGSPVVIYADDHRVGS
jgi:hypothetical protein